MPEQERFVTILAQALILASGGFLSVGSITIVILLLISDGGWRKGAAYALGYWGGYSLIGLSVILVGTNTLRSSGEGGGGVTASALSLLVGGLLLWLGWRNGRKPAQDSQDPPRLFAMLNTITPLKTLGLGAVVTIVNFKNLAIFLSAASVPLLSDLALSAKVMVVLLVALVFCASVLAPVLLYAAFPATAVDRLTRFRHTLETHSRAIGIWAPVGFGLLFTIRGVTGLL